MNVHGVGWSALDVTGGALFESARWVPGAEAFQWVDILRPAIYRWTPGQAVEHHPLELDYATCALPIDSETSLVSSGNRLHCYTWSTRLLSELKTVQLPHGVRFNDGNYSPSGELYIGTMSMLGHPSAGTLYRFDKAYEPTVVIDGVGISNGLVWHSSTQAFYVDSHARAVYELSCPGTRNQSLRTLITFPRGIEPDGLALAADGSLWVALWDGGEVVQIADRQVARRLPIPGQRPTSLAFGAGIMLVTVAQETEQPASLDGQVVWRRY